MEDYTSQNKAAWEYNAYDFWVQECPPEKRAQACLADPVGQLKKYAQYFDTYADMKIANICGSCGKKAVPLALLGADVTVFDFSEDNRHYAEELANLAGVSIDYQVCDVMAIDMDYYRESFDVVFMEGGILHYFHDIDRFFELMHNLLKPGGKMICSDFHPFTKVLDSLGLQQYTMSFFSTEVFQGEMAHARFMPEAVHHKMPLCSYRKYTLSEIINTVLCSGFILKQFDEHPSWENPDLPGEFTLIAYKNL